jgi:UDP-N-acetylmuramate: L-alanyl-gamma-D-glutamyl-meso-diaminopimelate ligase
MKIHLIAIGGSAMHNLAIALHQQGHAVSGSDDEIFEPSKSRLAKYGLLPNQMGWDEKNISDGLELVILGMHARPNNIELKRAQELGLKVLSYPEYLYENSKDKTRVVIAGSHGKTSITAMVLHSLHFHNRDCDYMVGAQLEGFETMVRLTNHNEFILLEGDEYLSSPLDPRPKFIHYKPNIALLSGIAWDHVNVFPDYEDYKKQFDQLLDCIEPGGVIIYNEDDQEVLDVIHRTKNEVKKFPYSLPAYRVEDQHFILDTFEGDLELKVFGAHNMSNLEGARWICNQMGLNDEEFYEAIEEFEGASKRLEKMDIAVDYDIYRDFAHAPSKVRASVSGTKETYGDKKLVAVFELHTFSSLSINFISQYKSSLDKADSAIVYYNPKVLEHKKLAPLDAISVKEAFGNPNIEVITDREELINTIKNRGASADVLLLMSSGNFDAINWTEELIKG